MFKVGDKVRIKDCDRNRNDPHFKSPIGTEYVVTSSDNTGVYAVGTYILNWRLELVKPTTTPHKHAALIKAWADGAQIQRFGKVEQEWQNCENPSWKIDCDYRIKPEPKPDRVETRWLAYNTEGKFMWGKETENPNVKYTFDGETGKLKAVELLS